MLIFDAHLDLGMNALMWNRDLRRSVDEIRSTEREMDGKGRGCNTVALPDMKRGRVAVALGTVLARTGSAPAPNLPTYASAEIAYGMAHGQLAHYRILEREGWVRLLRDRVALTAHWSEWAAWDADAAADDAGLDAPPIGLILSMEGADSIPSPDEVTHWWNDGLRAVGITHYQDNRYAHGTGTEGGLKPDAGPLLDALAAHGLILDLTHLADQAFWEVLEAWDGPVLASHNNCRALVPGQRQFSDAQLRAIVERDGVIGVALDAWMLHPGWVRRVTLPEVVGMEAVADQIAYVCELAGDAKHVAIGSDLDGGFGTEQTPRDLDTIADLQAIAGLLRARGFGEEDVGQVMHGNWLRFMRTALPAG